MGSSRFKIFRGFHEVKESLLRPVLTIGNFDGLHLGHREIITSIQNRAKEVGGTSVVYTFRPHPHRALRPNEKLPLINTYDEKLEILERMGIDAVIEEPFRRDFSTIEPEDFFRDVLLKKLSVHEIYVGYDFGFGKNRTGNLDVLAHLCQTKGVPLHVAKPLKIDSEICSSSKIREHLHTGKIQEANALLGREFFYRGVVVKGDGRGRKIGFPTANISIEDKLQIASGVYATNTICRGKAYKSITNVGLRPTFTDGQNVPITVETNIFDFESDIYGEKIEVRFYQRVRSEKKFNSVDELKAQIQRDIADVKNFLPVKSS